MSKVGQFDGLVLGGILGLIVAYPSVSTSFHNFLTGVIPASWTWFGSMTTNIVIIALGAVIGLLIDKTR